MSRSIRIVHTPSNTVLAQGPVGWGITPFEGNYYVSKKYLQVDGFRLSYVPGLCSYKFIYLWMDLVLASGERLDGLGWMYVVPNPLLPFIWFRVALPGGHPELAVQDVPAVDADAAVASSPEGS